MTLKLTSTKAALREAELRQDLEDSKAEEEFYREFVKNPGRRERPVRGLPEIHATIEIIELKLAEATREADAERAKLPTADEARKILETTKAEVATARKAFYTAIDAAQHALEELAARQHEHQRAIGNGERALLAAGIPHEGAELDGEPIELRGGIEHGDTVHRAVNNPITYEWAPSIRRHLNQ